MFSIWEKETFLAPQDVIIAGSGFVGLWSALHLKKLYPEKKITILERGLIPAGASGRNAGFACFGSAGELMSDGEKMGSDAMLKLVEQRFKGLEKIRKTFPEKQIDFSMSGGYELYAPQQIGREALEQNINYLNTLLKPVTGSGETYRLADEKILEFGFGHTQHLVKNRFEGSLHSGKLLQALAQKIAAKGVQILTGTDIRKINVTDSGVELETRAAGKPLHFHSKQVLLCTNAFTKELIPELDVVPARGQVLVTTALPRLPFRGTFHAEEGFYYFRNLGNRVLLGGARHKALAEEETTEMEPSTFIQQELENYLAEVILPGYRGTYYIEHRWAGIMAMGTEKSPVVKQLAKNVFCAVRMSGMGVALAPLVARQVAKMME